MRIELEIYLVIKIQDKMLQHIRVIDGNNELDIKFICRLKAKDVFQIIKDFFRHQKGYDTLDTIYQVPCLTLLHFNSFQSHHDFLWTTEEQGRMLTGRRDFSKT